MWLLTSVIPVLWMLKLEDYNEFGASVHSTLTPKPV